MDAPGLKKLWETSVQGLLQAPDYRVSKHWNTIFQDVADFLNQNPEIPPQKFVESQIKHMASKGLLDKMFPNVLSGEGAMKRYLSAPSEDLQERLVLESLQAQEQCFTAVCAKMGEEFAFSGRVVNFMPLFISFMRWKTSREIPPALLADAKTELLHKPMAKKFFDADFIRLLEL